MVDAQRHEPPARASCVTAKSRFPAGETDLNGDLVRPRHLLQWKTKHFVLPGPFQGKIGKSRGERYREPKLPLAA